MMNAVLRSRRTIALTLAAAAVGVLGLASIGGATAGATSYKAGTKTVNIRLQGRNLFFDGPKRIRSGAKLRIVNRTNPREVGPHSFTLANKAVVPYGPIDQRQCFKPHHICRKVAVAHDVDFQAQTLKKTLVTRGAHGWNRTFTKNREGDSWIAQKPGAEITQKVTAKPGKTLRYFCIIHPFMHGKVKVIG